MFLDQLIKEGSGLDQLWQRECKGENKGMFSITSNPSSRNPCINQNNCQNNPKWTHLFLPSGSRDGSLDTSQMGYVLKNNASKNFQ
jgi:hypothetical protein